MTRATALEVTLELLDMMNMGCRSSACRIRPGKVVGTECRCNPQIVQQLRMLAYAIENNPIHDTGITNG